MLSVTTLYTFEVVKIVQNFNISQYNLLNRLIHENRVKVTDVYSSSAVRKLIFYTNKHNDRQSLRIEHFGFSMRAKRSCLSASEVYI